MSEEPDLFPIRETLSPRLAWYRDHDVEISNPDEDGDIWARGTFAGREFEVCGKDEDAALSKLAKTAGARLWNEEGFARSREGLPS